MNDTWGYNAWRGYQQSKLAGILLANEFKRRFSSIESASLNPGYIATNISRNLTFGDYVRFVTVAAPRAMAEEGRISFLKTPEQGAATTVVVATTPELVNGAYYHNCQVDDPTESAKNDEDATLFDYCDDVTEIYQ
jgi:NAD(P)-dependent dehydrogenase (short-subunit alcohol dehydrogenase family)